MRSDGSLLLSCFIGTFIYRIVSAMIDHNWDLNFERGYYFVGGAVTYYLMRKFLIPKHREA